jgi:hypothetical protein
MLIDYVLAVVSPDGAPNVLISLDCVGVSAAGHGVGAS